MDTSVSTHNGTKRFFVMIYRVSMLRPPRHECVGFLRLLNASDLPFPGDRLLLRVDRTFQPTRSGTGSVPRRYHSHALGQDLPRSRTLLQTLHHGLQARFRTFPVTLGDGGDILLQVQIGQQEGRVEITLDRSNPTRAPMPAL